MKSAILKKVLQVCAILFIGSQQLNAQLIEDFESGSKSSYASGLVTLSTGSWLLDEALIGSTNFDARNGSQSVRMDHRDSESVIQMNFDYLDGIGYSVQADPLVWGN